MGCHSRLSRGLLLRSVTQLGRGHSAGTERRYTVTAFFLWAVITTLLSARPLKSSNERSSRERNPVIILPPLSLRVTRGADFAPYGILVPRAGATKWHLALAAVCCPSILSVFQLHQWFYSIIISVAAICRLQTCQFYLKAWSLPFTHS